MKKVGIIGTGIMGTGMAFNFLKKGYEVYVWNRHKEKIKSLVRKGAKVASSPREATAVSDIIFEVTANDESSKKIWLGKIGILAGADRNKILITSATLSVNWVDELSRICAKKQYFFFDMPLTGGRVGAESGNLTFLVGGDKNKLQKLKPDLRAVSNRSFYFGKAGSGTRFKLLLNMVQAMHLVIFGDAMRIAKNSLMNVNAVGDAFAVRLGATTAMGWRDYKRNPKPINFALKWIVKDLKYAKRFAGREEVTFLKQTLKKYKSALSKGYGTKDWTVITKF